MSNKRKQTEQQINRETSQIQNTHTGEGGFTKKTKEEWDELRKNTEEENVNFKVELLSLGWQYKTYLEYKGSSVDQVDRNLKRYRTMGKATLVLTNDKRTLEESEDFVEKTDMPTNVVRENNNSSIIPTDNKMLENASNKHFNKLLKGMIKVVKRFKESEGDDELVNEEEHQYQQPKQSSSYKTPTLHQNFDN